MKPHIFSFLCGLPERSTVLPSDLLKLLEVADPGDPHFILRLPSTFVQLDGSLVGFQAHIDFCKTPRPFTEKD